MTRRTRLILFCAGGALAFVLVAAAGGVFWLRGSLPTVDGTVRLAGVRAPVEVIRDADGVPHIFAAGEEDAFFALGYVHAQDRLWQMEAMRRVGAGRLSELAGAGTLRIDRFIRTLGLYRLAEKQVALLSAPARRMLDAYTRGVNGFLKTRDGPLPPEFVLLGHTPEPWRPADSLVWARIMALQLSQNWRRELLRLRLAKRLTAEQIDALWPGDSGPVPVTLPPRAKAAAAHADRVRAALPGILSPVDASNAWVLAGARTASGKPILANDPHLGFGAPILWYLARIETPTLSLAGATVPGVPLMVLGHNGTIAWGMTTTGGDVQDLYLETVDPGNPARYLTPAGPRPFVARVERIGVAGGDTVDLTVRETRHGPVISDILDDAAKALDDGRVLSLATPMLRADDRTPQALYAINRARSWDDFRAAVRPFHAPQQNLFYADTGGTIGMIAPGRVPLRGDRDGRMPADGTKAGQDWQGFIPADEVPAIRDPDTGFIMNANNRLTGPDYPYPLTRDWDLPYRAERLIELLPAAKGQTPADSARLQMDIVSPAARHLLPLMLRAAPADDRQRAAMELLRRWDYRMHRDRPEPLIYATWLHELTAALAADELGPLFNEYRGPRPRFAAAALTRNRAWCDDTATPQSESCDDRLRLSLDRALARIAETEGGTLADWRWGARHRARFDNRFFSAIPVLGRLANRAIETDGGNNTINRGQTVPHGGNLHGHLHGAGLRAVYDLGDLANSRFMIATGQSGNPFSPHYDDLIARWRDGGHLTIAGDRASLRQRAEGILMLMPGE